jgi:prepilin signal peptidase PulO-like enzyme (type II secretory pathway)
MFVAGALAGVALGAAATLCHANALTVPEIAKSVCVGVALILVCAASGGAVGMGDGLCLAVSGLYLPWEKNFSLLFGGLVISALAGLVTLARGKGRKAKIPFLPCLLLPGLVVVCL